jgi:hypothetical protein
LHFILPLVFFSSKSHQSFWETVSACVGGTQDDVVMTVCALTELAAKPSAARAARAFNLMNFMVKYF